MAGARARGSRPQRRPGGSPPLWVVFGAGALAYASGHGIHLAANSVGNVDPGPTGHLWDEVVGHYIWFAGVALVVAALAVTMCDRPRAGVIGHVLAIAVGLTWATNAIGGGTVLFSLVIALAASLSGGGTGGPWRASSGSASHRRCACWWPS